MAYILWMVPQIISRILSQEANTIFSTWTCNKWPICSSLWLHSNQIYSNSIQCNPSSICTEWEWALKYNRWCLGFPYNTPSLIFPETSSVRKWSKNIKLPKSIFKIKMNKFLSSRRTPKRNLPSTIRNCHLNSKLPSQRRSQIPRNRELFQLSLKNI